MRKYAVIIGTLAAIGLITSLVMGDVHTATYKGSALCKMCHKALPISKDIIPAYEASAHPKALQKADVEGAIVADFSSNPAFTKDKVAYVLGKGVNQQAYMDADFQVLPALWDVKSKSWKPQAAADGSTQCVGCHVTAYDPIKKTQSEFGVGCEACHGPGSEHTAGDKKAIVNPKNLEFAQKNMVCGQCHSVGKDTSGKYAFPVNFRPGDDLTKFFVDAKPTAPGRNQQYSEWITSKHATVGVGCTTCHDPHGVGTTGPQQLKKPVTDLCLGCHAATIKDLATHAPNAAAGATCATCHMPMGQHTFAKAH
ncbi:MAG TPA: cytochrome c3 family protein [Armatimonadota bacterium]|nr:cytochrome c3 family protein [Armatimonadota bacterium]